MASRSLSPGGALLRASRMFSVPPPLPRPPMESDTATTPHPLHLSVTTPYASLQRGDWGFKRPLPLRSTTKTSTPLIRVEAIDTHEHVTDFRSSADHALTLGKWQELDVPLTVPPKESTANKSNHHNDILSKSVFESDIDTTATVDNSVSKFDDRWRFKGPFLASQSEGDFSRYLKGIRSKKAEFREFLREQCAATLTAERALEARINPPADGDQGPIMVRPAEVTEDQLNDYIKRLRTNVKELNTQIRNFLDLAPINATSADTSSADLSKFLEDTLLGGGGPTEFQHKVKELPASMSPYGVHGPPKTHPSAGLSYSRSAARIFNHPEFGPQKQKAPVEARIIMPKVKQRTKAALGVGGFVTDVPSNDSTFNSNQYSHSKNPTIPGLVNIEIHKVGGSKTWIHPVSANVGNDGQVVLNVVHGDEAAVAIKEGRGETFYPSKDIQATRQPAAGFPLSLNNTTSKPATSAVRRGSYGLSSELDGFKAF